MGWIEVKSVWLDCPYFADVFEGREALEGLQPPPIIVGVDEVVQDNGMSAWLDVEGDFLEMLAHRLTVAAGHDGAGGFAFSGTDRTEDPCRGSSLILRR